MEWQGANLGGWHVFRKTRSVRNCSACFSSLVLAVVSYVQLSEIRQMRDDMVTLQRTTEVENQGLREELTSLQSEVAQLDSSEDLAAIKQSISRLRLQTLGIWVDDEPLTSLQTSQIARARPSAPIMPSLQTGPGLWWEQYPDTVRTITQSDYGAVWPFESDEELLGCHGGEVIVVVEGGDLMVDPVSPSLHDFTLDMAVFSVFDASSPELDAARDRMTEEAQSLCNVKVVR